MNPLSEIQPPKSSDNWNKNELKTEPNKSIGHKTMAEIIGREVPLPAKPKYIPKVKLKSASVPFLSLRSAMVKMGMRYF